MATVTSKEELESRFKELVTKELRGEGVSTKRSGKLEPPEPLFDTDAANSDFENTVSSVFGIKIPTGLPDPEIKVFKAEDWDEIVRPHVPDIDPDYQFQEKQLIELAVAMLLGDNTWISGPTGSGKTTLVEQFCAKTGRPFIRINGRGDMESGPIFGQYIVEDGATIWKDGACTEAVKYGAVFCQDEPTVLPPEIAMGYQWLLENNGKLFLSDKAGDSNEKLIRPHTNFRFVCCDNTRGLGDDTGAFAGTNVWNTATLDRYSTTIHLDYLTKKHEEAILKAKIDGMTGKLSRYLVQMAGLVRNAYQQGEVSFTMSPRTLLSWADKCMYYRCPHQAFKVSFYEKLGADDERTAIRNMFETVFGERYKG